MNIPIFPAFFLPKESKAEFGNESAQNMPGNQSICASLVFYN